MPAVLCLQVDSQKAICGCWDGTIKIIDSRSNAGVLKSIKAHRNAINCMQLLKKDRLVTGSYDLSIRIWEPLQSCDYQDIGSLHSSSSAPLSISLSSKFASGENQVIPVTTNTAASTAIASSSSSSRMMMSMIPNSSSAPSKLTFGSLSEDKKCNLM